MLAQAYHQAGFDAVLIGEALVKSHNPSEFIEACRDD
jgi:indole-3-glycerol phosphate synthase